MVSSGEYVEELLDEFPPKEFLYDHESRLFIINGNEVSLSGLLSAGLHSEERSLKSTEELIATTPLILWAWNNPSHLPLFYRWLLDDDRLDELRMTQTVMREVYGELVGQQFDSDAEIAGFGFHAGLLRPGHPTLSVIGSCACIGVDPDGDLFGYESWEEGFASYSFHNVDSDPQMISLYAGLGHLASRSMYP